MQLLSTELQQQLPPLYSHGHGWDAVAMVRFVSKNGKQEWFASAFDGTDIFYGLVVGNGEMMLDLFSVTELEALQGDVMRDTVFVPATLRHIEQSHRLAAV